MSNTNEDQWKMEDNAMEGNDAGVTKGWTEEDGERREKMIQAAVDEMKDRGAVIQMPEENEALEAFYDQVGVHVCMVTIVGQRAEKMGVHFCAIDTDPSGQCGLIVPVNHGGMMCIIPMDEEQESFTLGQPVWIQADTVKRVQDMGPLAWYTEGE